jgi:predicted kinase/predicted N-acetyltransferase YhbS
VPTVHAIFGYLGSGKTTLARQLEYRTGGVRLSIDEWTIGLSGDDVNLDPDIFSRTWGLLGELWPRVIRSGVDVILDFGFWARAGRDEARGMAASLGAEFRLYSVTCNDETARARCIRRNDIESYSIDDSTFDLLRAKFEPLGGDEVSIVIESDGGAPAFPLAPDSGALEENGVVYRWREPVLEAEVDTLHREAFADFAGSYQWRRARPFSLGWVTATEDGHLVGFANLAWDGDHHALLLDVAVAPNRQRRGIGRAVVVRALAGARRGGCEWVHVDFEGDLQPFYAACGFRPTAAGVLHL